MGGETRTGAERRVGKGGRAEKTQQKVERAPEPWAVMAAPFSSRGKKAAWRAGATLCTEFCPSGGKPLIDDDINRESSWPGRTLRCLGREGLGSLDSEAG